MPTSLRKIVNNSFHDLPASGGHLAFKATCDAIRDRFWWPTMPTDVRTHIEACLVNTSSHPTARSSCLWDTALSRAHSIVLPLTLSNINVSQGNRCLLSVIDHLTRFDILIAIKDKTSRTIVRHLVEHVFSVFDPPEHWVPIKGRNLSINLSRYCSQCMGVRKRVQPPVALEATLF